MGESHGEGYGVVIDGCPQASPDEGLIQEYLKRRKPGQSKFSTTRKEEDKVRILSGVLREERPGLPYL